MKKTVLFLTALLLSLPSFLGATITRDAGMGLSDVPWMVDGLQGSVYINPANAVNFTNRVFFDRTGFENGLNSGGILWNPVAALTIGIVSGLPVSGSLWNSSAAQGLYYLGNYTPKAASVESTNLQGTLLEDGTSEVHLADPAGGDKNIDLNQQAFRIFTAYDFGKINAGLSFGFSSGWDDKTYNDGADKDSYSLSEVQYDTVAGGNFRLTDTMDIGVDVTFKYYDLQNSYDLTMTTGANPGFTNISYGSDGAMDILAGVSYNIKVGTKQKIHTRVQYGLLNRSGKSTLYDTRDINGGDATESVSDSLSRTGHEVRAGVSDELTLMKSLTIFVGINAIYSLFSYEFKADSIPDTTTIENDFYKADATVVQVPLYVGMELRPHKNFEVRVGLSHVLYNTTMIDSSFYDFDGATNPTAEWSETLNNSNSTVFNLGLTWKFYNVRLDWLLNVDIFTRGPDFISGYSMNTNPDRSTPIATSFSISYDFDSFWKGVAGNGDDAGKRKIE